MLDPLVVNLIAKPRVQSKMKNKMEVITFFYFLFFLSLFHVSLQENIKIKINEQNVKQQKQQIK